MKLRSVGDFLTGIKYTTPVSLSISQKSKEDFY